jgi:hypothetical protein
MCKETIRDATGRATFRTNTYSELCFSAMIGKYYSFAELSGSVRSAMTIIPVGTKRPSAGLAI